MSQPAQQMTQVGHLVAEIASVAYSADLLCYRFSPNEANIEHYELQLRLLRETVQRMGWLADLCAMEMGQATAIEMPRPGWRHPFSSIRPLLQLRHERRKAAPDLDSSWAVGSASPALFPQTGAKQVIQ